MRTPGLVIYVLGVILLSAAIWPLETGRYIAAEACVLIIFAAGRLS